MAELRGLGVPQLERLLEPVPEGTTLLFVNDPGVEAEPFLYQAAHEALRGGRDVVYAVTNRSPHAVAKAMREFGFELEHDGARVHFLDAYSALMGSASDAAYSVANPASAEEFVRAIERAAAKHKGAALVIDSLSNLIDNGSVEAFLSHSERLMAAARKFAVTSALFTRWPYPDPVLERLDDFDGRVSLRAVEDRVVLSQYFKLDRASWKTDVDAKPRLYKSVRPGGVFVYIPKIVVTGPFNAGKSSFVRAVSDTSVSVDHLGTTVALDHGRVTMDGLTADVFGTPGQERFDPILKIVAGQAVGVILVVDSTRPDTFARGREMLLATWKRGLPAIVAANKQDLPDALPASEVMRILQPPPNVRVVACRGQDPETARNVLRELIDQILTGVPAQ